MVRDGGAGRPVQASLELDFRVRLARGNLEVQLKTDSRAVAVFGPSGGGKSTMLKALAGVDRRARGSATVRGEIWFDSRRNRFLPPWKRRVGWVPQEYLLFPHLRVLENLTFAGASVEDAREMGERLMVAHLLDRRPRSLSGGEQQRVALGRALLAGPRVLLLDEPFSALDRPLRNQMTALLREHVRREDLVLLLVSHDEADAGALAQEHWMLSQGSLVRVE